MVLDAGEDDMSDSLVTRPEVEGEKTSKTEKAPMTFTRSSAVTAGFEALKDQSMMLSPQATSPFYQGKLFEAVLTTGTDIQ